MVLKRAVAIADFLLGFVALSVFAVLVLRQASPSDMAWQRAFVIAGALAVVEVAILVWRERPANRLVLGANLWLIAGGLAVVTKQWWWLQLYQRWDAAGVYGFMVAAAVATMATSAGFVGVRGPRRPVLHASLLLLAAATTLLIAALTGHLDPRAAWPVIGLAYLNLLLRWWVARQPG